MSAWRPAPGLALLALLLAVSAGADPSGAPSGPITLETLMHRMASSPGVRAEFREEKTLALLEAPLVSEGTLYFVPPSRMARITSQPGRSVLVIDGGKMSYTDEAGADDVDLAGNRVAQAVVENFVVLFAGDLAALRERYQVEFDAEGLRWRMQLRPNRAPLSQFIASVELRGVGPAMEEMVILEADGDRSTTRFGSVETDTRFSAEELARLFPPGPTRPAP